MQATVQRPLDLILSDLGESAGVFVLGCGDCATVQRFGGAEQCREMAERLTAAGVRVTGRGVPAEGEATCDLTVTRELVAEHQDELAAADTVLLLACPQGLEAVARAVGERRIVRGTHIITGDTTGGGESQVSFCHFCSECIAELTWGLCPHAYCPKGLLNGPCGGAQAGRCEVLPSRHCVWELIYRRLRERGRLDVLEGYQQPADFGITDTEQ